MKIRVSRQRSFTAGLIGFQNACLFRVELYGGFVSLESDLRFIAASSPAHPNYWEHPKN
jgi:hypothetical protein